VRKTQCIAHYKAPNSPIGGSVSVLEIFLKGLFIFLGLLAMAVISIPGKPVLGTYAPQENNQRVAMAMLGFVMLVLGTFTLSLAGNQIATKLAASKWPRIEGSSPFFAVNSPQ
jgi:hypothetical protein